LRIDIISTANVTSCKFYDSAAMKFK